MGDDDVSRRQRSFDGKHLVVGALLDDVEQGTMHVLLLVLLGDLRPSLSNRSQFFQNLLANRRIRHTELREAVVVPREQIGSPSRIR